MRKVVAVFGSAKSKVSEEVVEKARVLGKAIARNDCVMLMGACPGIPYEAAKEAKGTGGFVIGISPATNQQEHTEKYGYPIEGFDFIVYTGSGTKGRNVISVRSCDIAVLVSGGIGTLNEFTIAFDEGKVIGVLTGTGGITDMIEDIIAKTKKETGAKVFYDSDPEKLLEKLLLA